MIKPNKLVISFSELCYCSLRCFIYGRYFGCVGYANVRQRHKDTYIALIKATFQIGLELCLDYIQSVQCWL